MKKLLALVLALVMTLGLATVSSSAAYSDKADIDNEEAVDVVTAIGIFEGKGGAFDPDAQLTRAEASKIIAYLMLGNKTAASLKGTGNKYSDVPADNFAAGYIEYLTSVGVVSGVGGGNFDPNGKVTATQLGKMLLVALGYDAEIEGFVGSDWSINIQKLANEADLYDGNDDVQPNQPVTRDEAALYVFNTLKAPLVEYDSKIRVDLKGEGNVTIGNNNAKYVTTTIAKTQTISSTKLSNSNDYTVEFAEKYYDDLKLVKNTDDFGRPQSLWTNKAEKVGEYVDTPDLTYNDNTKLGTIYADLKMSIADESAEVYINGVKGKSVNVSKNNDLKIANDNENKGKVGVGSTVDVYYDDVDNQVTICVIDNYVGEVASVNAKASSPYINVSSYSTVTGFKQKFETDDAASFEEGKVVLFTFSDKAGEIKDVKVAESSTDTITVYTKDKNITFGGSVVKLARNWEYVNDGAPVTNREYTVYTDQYGYAIYIDEKEFSANEYALVLLANKANDLKISSKDEAKLLTSDGTLLSVDTDDDYTNLLYKIVTYRKGADGKYVLRSASNSYYNWTATTLQSNANDIRVNGILTNGSNSFELKNTMATVKTGNTKDAGMDQVYTNSETVFVVALSDDKGDTTYNVFTGIKNAPNINTQSGLHAKGTVNAAWTMRNSNLVGVMFLDVVDGSHYTSGSTDILFLASRESVSKRITDADNNQYYTYNAVKDGEITTVKVKSDATGLTAGDDTKNEVYSGVTTNSKGFITKVKAVSKNDYQTIDYQADDTKTAKNELGIWKLAGKYTIGLTSEKDRYTVASDAKIYKIDTDGNIEKVNGAESIVSDSEASILALLDLDDGDIAYLFIQENNTNPKNLAGTTTTTLTRDNYSSDNAFSSAVNAALKKDNVTLNEDFTATQSINIPGGRTLTINGSLTNQTTITINKNATLTVRDDLDDSGHITNWGTGTFNGGTNTITSSSIETKAGAVTEFTNANAVVTVTGSLTTAGTLIIGSGSSTNAKLVVSTKAKVTFAETADATINGDLEVDDSATSFTVNSPKVSVEGNAAIEVANGSEKIGVGGNATGTAASKTVDKDFADALNSFNDAIKKAKEDYAQAVKDLAAAEATELKDKETLSNSADGENAAKAIKDAEEALATLTSDKNTANVQAAERTLTKKVDAFVAAVAKVVAEAQQKAATTSEISEKIDAKKKELLAETDSNKQATEYGTAVNAVKAARTALDALKEADLTASTVNENVTKRNAAKDAKAAAESKYQQAKGVVDGFKASVEAADTLDAVKAIKAYSASEYDKDGYVAALTTAVSDASSKWTAAAKLKVTKVEAAVKEAGTTAALKTATVTVNETKDGQGKVTGGTVTVTIAQNTTVEEGNTIVLTITPADCGSVDKTEITLTYDGQNWDDTSKSFTSTAEDGKTMVPYSIKVVKAD